MPLVVAVVLALIVAAPARAADAGTLAAGTAAAWAAQQRPDGSFPDYVTARDPPGHRRDAYGPATLGGALVLAGIRTGDAGLRAAGLRAVAYALAHPDRSPRGAFELVALAGAFAAARDALTGDPAFDALRPAWERRLATARHATLGIRRSFGNMLIVEAVAVLEIQRLGLPSDDPAAIAGGDRRRSAALARRAIDVMLPAAAREATTKSPAGTLTMLADPPCNPPAYHALALGMLARAVQLRGDGAARRVFQAAARASWALMAPDGDVASFGRGQEQSWAPAFTAYGALVAAGRAAGPWPARFGAVAQRALDRLARVHADPTWGLWITPAFASGPLARRGLDFYAAAAPYTGLTLLALEWAAAAGAPAPGGRIAADDPGAYHVGRGAGCFVTQRAGRTWMVVKRAPAVSEHAKADHTHDLRYDSGLLGLQTLGADGAWRVVQPAPPLTERFDSAGPALRDRGRLARAVGRGDLEVRGNGTIVLPARFAPHHGRPLRRTARIRFQPAGCGARIIIPARRGERWEYSAFFAGAPAARNGEISDGRRRVRFTHPARVRFSGGYSSGLDARLKRARIAFAPATGPIVIELCDAAAARAAGGWVLPRAVVGPGRLERALPPAPWTLSLTVRLRPRSVLVIGDRLRLRRGAGPAVTLAAAGVRSVLTPRPGWPGDGRHRLELTGPDDPALAVDGRRFEAPALGADRLVVKAVRGSAVLEAVIAEPAGGSARMLLHRLASLRLRSPPGRFPIGTADAGDRVHYARDWTAGFWPSALWEASSLEAAGGLFARWALEATSANLGREQSDTHDLGFIYGRSSVRAYERGCRFGARDGVCARLRRSGLAAAGRLLRLAATNRAAGMIPTRSGGPEADVIIDSVMNTGLLAWASRETRGRTTPPSPHATPTASPSCSCARTARPRSPCTSAAATASRSRCTPTRATRTRARGRAGSVGDLRLRRARPPARRPCAHRHRRACRGLCEATPRSAAAPALRLRRAGLGAHRRVRGRDHRRRAAPPRRRLPDRPFLLRGRPALAPARGPPARRRAGPRPLAAPARAPRLAGVLARRPLSLGGPRRVDVRARLRARGVLLVVTRHADACCGDWLAELGEQPLQAIAQLAVDQLQAGVEGVGRAADAELVVEHVGAGGGEHLAQLGLGPDGAEQAGAGADDRDRLPPQGVAGIRA